MNINFIRISVPLLFFTLVAVLVGTGTNKNGYELLFTQPLSFGLAYAIVLRRYISWTNIRPFYLVFTAICFVRYVLLPLLVVISGYYDGRSMAEPLKESYFTAVLLMNWELLVSVLTILFLESRKGKVRNGVHSNKSLVVHKIPTFDLGYVLFGFLVLGLIVVFPKGLSSVHFIFPSESGLESDELGTLDNFVSYSILVLKSLVFLVVAKKLGYRYQKSHKSRYLLFALAAALLNVFIYWGTNRSDILISAVASVLTLHVVFGSIVLRYALIGAWPVMIVLSGVTQYRESISISDGQSRLVDTTDTFQVYVGGVYNVALAIETKEYFPEASDWKVLALDILRPMIGVNILLKDAPQIYSNVFFNMRVWTHVDRRSQILPMIGQGNLFFGPYFAPVLAIFFIFLADFIERVRASTVSVEVYYFLTLALTRLGFMMGQNTMNVINDLSMNLFLFIIVFHVNRMIKPRRRREA